MKTLAMMVAQAHHVKGAANRSVLFALSTFADRNGCNAFPSQATLAQAAGVCDRTVRRALAYLEDTGVIRRTGGRRSRRGRAVIVWQILRAALKPDTVAGRPAKPLQKQKGRQGKERGEADAWAILASQYGWATLQRWSEAATQAALTRIMAHPL